MNPKTSTTITLLLLLAIFSYYTWIYKSILEVSFKTFNHNNLMDYKTVTCLGVIGVPAVLMVVTAPTLENHLAIAVNQPVVKKVNVKDPPTKVKKDPPRKRFVKRCGFFRGKRVCRWVPVPFRGPVGIRPPMGIRPPRFSQTI